MIIKNAIKTVTRATTPNSAGVNKRANIAPMMIEINTPEYLVAPE